MVVSDPDASPPRYRRPNTQRPRTQRLLNTQRPNTQRPRKNVGIRTDVVYERYRSRRDDQNNVWWLLPQTPRRRVIAAQTPNAQGSIDWSIDWSVDYFNQTQANPYPGVTLPLRTRINYYYRTSTSRSAKAHRH